MVSISVCDGKTLTVVTNPTVIPVPMTGAAIFLPEL